MLEISRIKILSRKFPIIYIFRFIIEHTQVNFLISATSVTKSSEAGTHWTIIKSLINLKPSSVTFVERFSHIVFD